MHYKKIIFYALLLIGLLVRLYSCFFTGHAGDMNQYMDWGNDLLSEGLPQSYHGIYYPLQYQIFGLLSYISHIFSIPEFIVFKWSNLPFDIGILYLLICILKKNHLSEYYALLYWINPWFLNNFILGFVDTQYTFFILLSVFLLKDNNQWKNYLIAGIPLGLAFVLKPQVLMLVFAWGIAFLFFIYKHKDKINALLFFLPAVVVFLFYELYFTVALYPSVYIESKNMDISSWLFLPAHYLHVKNISPGLTNSSLNFWYLIADLLREKNEPIYSVSSKIEIIPHLSINTLTLLTIILIVSVFVYKNIQNKANINQSVLIRIITFVGLLVPFFMTNSHYNHAYSGSVFLILIIAFTDKKNIKIAACLLSLCLFFNMLELGGLGGLSVYLSIPKASPVVLYLTAVVSTICVSLILVNLFKSKFK